MIFLYRQCIGDHNLETMLSSITFHSNLREETLQNVYFEGLCLSLILYSYTVYEYTIKYIYIYLRWFMTYNVWGSLHNKFNLWLSSHQQQQQQHFVTQQLSATALRLPGQWAGRRNIRQKRRQRSSLLFGGRMCLNAALAI